MPRNASASIASQSLALERVEPLIYEIRGEKVILDSDLARIYGVTTKRLNQQVKRNQERFPDDFVFQLSADEGRTLRSQLRPVRRNCLLKKKIQGRNLRPYLPKTRV